MANNDAAIVSLSEDVANNLLNITNLKVHTQSFTFQIFYFSKVRESKHTHYIVQVMKLNISFFFIKNRLMWLLMLLILRRMQGTSLIT